LFQEYIFWLEVPIECKKLEIIILPMDNIILMAVVNTRENLFHKNGGVFLCELASSNDLIEELSSFAYPIEKRYSLVYIIGLLSHNVISLLVFEEFIHLDNIGMIL
jgi:hypothetical protein